MKKNNNNIEIYNLFNSSKDLRDFANKVTDKLLELLSCSSVGIRLKQGNQYPYFLHKGFPNDFVFHKLHLTVFETFSGENFKDCVCGVILDGRLNSSERNFTKYGSFCTNFLSKENIDCSPSLKYYCMNVCRQREYESIIIIPLKIRGEIFGTLQFNDKEPNKFNKKTVFYLEEIAIIFSILLSHFKMNFELDDIQNKYKVLVENSSLPMFYCDNNLNLLYMNKEAELIFRKDKNELLGNNIYKMIPEPSDDLRKMLNEALNGVTSNTLEKCFGLGGGVKCFLINIQGAKDLEGNIIGVQLFFHEVNENKQHEIREIDHLNGLLGHADRLASVGQLTSSVAHELNDPLSSILGFAQLLIKEKNLTEENKKDLQNIIDGAIFSRSIIRDLLDYTRKENTQKQKCNLNSIFEKTVRLLKSSISNKNIEIIEQFNPHIPDIDADENQIQQVQMNIISNAVKAMPYGGTLTLSTSTMDNIVTMTITDTGVGMDQGIINNIFDPFFTTRPKGEGTGLGLFLVQNILKSHDAKIKIESVVGQGSRISIEFKYQQGS